MFCPPAVQCDRMPTAVSLTVGSPIIANQCIFLSVQVHAVDTYEAHQQQVSIFFTPKTCWIGQGDTHNIIIWCAINIRKIVVYPRPGWVYRTRSLPRLYVCRNIFAFEYRINSISAFFEYHSLSIRHRSSRWLDYISLPRFLFGCARSGNSIGNSILAIPPLFVFAHAINTIRLPSLITKPTARKSPRPVSVGVKDTDKTRLCTEYRSMRCTVSTLPRSLAACATHEVLHLRSAPDVESEFTIYLINKSRIPGPASDRCPGASHGPCLFACLPVCQHRSVRYPLGSPTNAINQTVPAAAVEVSYVLLIHEP